MWRSTLKKRASYQKKIKAVMSISYLKVDKGTLKTVEIVVLNDILFFFSASTRTCGRFLGKRVVSFRITGHSAM